MSELQELIDAKKQTFPDPSAVSDAVALGHLISTHFEWDGLAILNTASTALEDANFHSEAATVDGLAAQYADDAPSEAASDPVTEALREALAEEGQDGKATSTIQTGRGGSGKLRNFKAMNDDKLAGVLAAIRSENNDPEALAKCEDEARTRGLA